MSAREPRVGDTVEYVPDGSRFTVSQATEGRRGVLFVLCGNRGYLWSYLNPTDWRVVNPIDPPEDSGAGEGGL